MTPATIPGEDLVFALARAIEAGLVDDPAAPPLLRWWSERGSWTRRQTAMAVALLLKSDEPIAGETEAIPPHPYQRGGAWWEDTRSERQALRGRKSGIMRRWRTRERDSCIKRWYERGKYTVAEMASHFKLSRQGIYYILRRTISSPLPKVVKQTIMNMPIGSGREPPRAVPVDSGKRTGRTRRIYRALMRWCGLRSVRNLPDSAVVREAERLNAAEERPLRPARLAGTVRAVCRMRERWA